VSADRENYGCMSEDRRDGCWEERPANVKVESLKMILACLKLLIFTVFSVKYDCTIHRGTSGVQGQVDCGHRQSQGRGHAEIRRGIHR